jgi:ATP-binding protein involved in chromosome partitioning
MTGAFGVGAGQATSEALGVPFLGAIPFDAGMVAEGDAGQPTVRQRPGSEAARAFDAIATATAGALGWQRVAAES